MKILFLSSEAFPFAKTGGLGDVAGALPAALAKKGCKVKAFLPFYKGIKVATQNERWGYVKHEGVEFYFVKNDKYFKRDGLYGTLKADYGDNLERFAFFCREALSIAKEVGFHPDILHANDWQSALSIAYLESLYAFEDNFRKTKTLLTIHNLAYQGLFESEKFPFLELPSRYFDMRYFEFYGKINLLKGGIVFADSVNTVSPTYAKQIQNLEYGCALEGVLKDRRSNLSGILNGIDYDVWNPAKDKFIYKKYGVKNIQGKAVNKCRLQKALGLNVDKDIFLLGMVSRIVEQKGLDILCAALPRILKNCQVVIQGLGDEKYEALLKKLARKYKNNLAVKLAFDEGMAHKIYAASDAFLMPSRFEPCGLSQMVSYKYATVPIAHATGGLSDTVIDVRRDGGGFAFSDYSAADLIVAVHRACDNFADKKAWSKLVKKIAVYNFSWGSAAEKYIELYRSLIKQD